MRPAASASVHFRLPVAGSSHVRGSVATTFGGVPRVWRGPSTHCTAAIGGTRTSTLWPGAIWASVRRLRRTALASAGRGGSDHGSTAATAARISWGSTELVLNLGHYLV